MSSFRRWFRRHDAFTLIEMIAALAIASILFIGFTGTFRLALESDHEISVADDRLSSGRHALDFISKEIRSAQAVLPFETEEYPYRHNMGYALQSKEGEKYHYIFYYLDGENLRRYSVRNTISDRVEYKSGKTGINTITDSVFSIEGSYYDLEKKLIRICIVFVDGDEIYETAIYK